MVITHFYIPSKKEELQKFIPDIGNRLGIFKVINKNSNEIVLGEDSKYLDFRNSILIEVKNQTYTVIVSTIVKFNRFSGKAYFFIIKPFHKQIVKAMMQNMIKKMM